MNHYVKAVALSALIFFAGGCGVHSAAPAAQPPSSGNSSSATQTYVNGTYGFSLKYPNEFTFVTPTYGQLQDQVVQLQIAKSSYPHTNFGDADVTVSQAYAASLEACLQIAPGTATAQYDQSRSTSINGIPFYTDTTSDAGAGNIYAGTAYRTFHGTDCIELDETIHTTQIADYPAGTVSAFNAASVQPELDSVVRSFMFTGV